MTLSPIISGCEQFQPLQVAERTTLVTCWNGGVDWYCGCFSIISRKKAALRFLPPFPFFFGSWRSGSMELLETESSVPLHWWMRSSVVLFRQQYSDNITRQRSNVCTETSLQSFWSLGMYRRVVFPPLLGKTIVHLNWIPLRISDFHCFLTAQTWFWTCFWIATDFL